MNAAEFEAKFRYKPALPFDQSVYNFAATRLQINTQAGDTAVKAEIIDDILKIYWLAPITDDHQLRKTIKRYGEIAETTKLAPYLHGELVTADRADDSERVMNLIIVSILTRMGIPEPKGIERFAARFID